MQAEDKSMLLMNIKHTLKMRILFQVILSSFLVDRYLLEELGSSFQSDARLIEAKKPAFILFGAVYTL